jgi:hypothetical protein
LFHWRGIGRAEPGYSSAGKKRGFCRLRPGMSATMCYMEM